MIQNMIGELTKKELDMFEGVDCCPYCNSKKFKMDATSRRTLVLCVACGKFWLVNKTNV